jgi:predicted nucleic acid-binding protein
MVDANIIVSAILFKKSVVAKAFDHIIDNNILTLSQYTIDEVEDVRARAFRPNRRGVCSGSEPVTRTV